MWLCVLGAALLAGSLEATHPADFGSSLLLKLFEYAASIKGQAASPTVSRFWRDWQLWLHWPSLPGAVWSAGVSASSACLEHSVDLMRRSSCSINDACSGAGVRNWA